DSQVMKEEFMHKIIVVAAATALCVPAAAQQQSGSPARQPPTQMQSQEEMQRIINEEKQELAEDQVSPSGVLETTGQGSRDSSATQQTAPQTNQHDSPSTFGQGSRDE